MSPDPPTPDEEAKRVWSLGSYADIAPHFLSMAAHVVRAAEVSDDDDVLDIACGTGSVAITAARRGARVAGLDITPAMLEDARSNAAIAGVEDVDWREGSATDLPFPDDAFDVALSNVGHMFADPPDVAAGELLRVTRPGGRTAFTSWTPESVVPAMGAVLTEYLPTTPDAPEPPFRWGDPDVVRERLGDGVDGLAFETDTILTPALSPAHYWEAGKTQSGLFIDALEVVDEADLPSLRDEMIEAIEPYFVDRENAVAMEYRLASGTVSSATR